MNPEDQNPEQPRPVKFPRRRRRSVVPPERPTVHVDALSQFETYVINAYRDLSEIQQNTYRYQMEADARRNIHLRIERAKQKGGAE